MVLSKSGQQVVVKDGYIPLPAKAAEKALVKSGKTIDPNKKSNKFKPGTVALREIKFYQKSVDMLLPRQPF